MIEIIALVFLSKNIGNLAIEKNQKAGKWKIIFVVSWILAELVGAVIGFVIFQGYFQAILVGIGCAVSSYFIIKNYLQKLPNNEMYDIENIGDN